MVIGIASFFGARLDTHSVTNKQTNKKRSLEGWPCRCSLKKGKRNAGFTQFWTGITIGLLFRKKNRDRESKKAREENSSFTSRTQDLGSEQSKSGTSIIIYMVILWVGGALDKVLKVLEIQEKLYRSQVGSKNNLWSQCASGIFNLDQKFHEISCF